MTRETIIRDLDRTVKTGSLYDDLKSCIITHGKLNDRIDQWFEGMINSLYYKPNKLALVLEGNEVYNTAFFSGLLYDRSLYSEFDFGKPIYENLIIDLEFDKTNMSYPSRDNFTVIFGEYPCDKRLASYCSTASKWVYPKRNDFIVIPVIEINWNLYNSIDKRELWIEIFNKFNPKKS